MSRVSHPIRSLASMISEEEDIASCVVALEDRLPAAGRGLDEPARSRKPRPMFSVQVGDVDPSSPEFQRRLEEAREIAVREVQEHNSRELASLGERYAATLMRLDEAIQSISKVMTSEVVDLALLVAQEIVHAELSVSPELVFSSVERALEGVAQEGTVAVRLHPDDLVEVRVRLQEQGALTMTLSADPTLRRGDCIVEMPDRIIDASLGARLEAVRETLVRTLMVDERDDDRGPDSKET